jgi:hypothetical protein
VKNKPGEIDLEHRPKVALSLLEADQMVTVKEHTRFGPRRLSSGVRVLLWCLRLYVIVMLGIVLLSVLRTFQQVR